MKISDGTTIFITGDKDGKTDGSGKYTDKLDTEAYSFDKIKLWLKEFSAKNHADLKKNKQKTNNSKYNKKRDTASINRAPLLYILKIHTCQGFSLQ